MPKIKTKRIAKKKFHVNARGLAKHGQANTSHNTGKKSAKWKRQLRKMAKVDHTNMRAIKGMLPYA